MARKKSGRGRSVGFRMPEDRYDLLARVAEARGVDVSAVINQLLAEAAPELERWLAEHVTGMAGRYLQDLHGLIGPQAAAVVRDVCAALPPFTVGADEGGEPLRRRAEAHYREAVRAAAAAAGRAGVEVAPETIAEHALFALGMGAFDAMRALQAPARQAPSEG